MCIFHSCQMDFYILHKLGLLMCGVLMLFCLKSIFNNVISFCSNRNYFNINHNLCIAVLSKVSQLTMFWNELWRKIKVSKSSHTLILVYLLAASKYFFSIEFWTFLTVAFSCHTYTICNVIGVCFIFSQFTPHSAFPPCHDFLTAFRFCTTCIMKMF